MGVEERTEAQRQGFAGVISTVNGLSAAIHALSPKILPASAAAHARAHSSSTHVSATHARAAASCAFVTTALRRSCNRGRSVCLRQLCSQLWDPLRRPLATGTWGQIFGTQYRGVVPLERKNHTSTP
jgi:hypothetical protein